MRRWLMVLAACGKSDSTPKQAPAEPTVAVVKPPVEPDAAPPAKPAQLELPAVDTSTWKRVPLAKLGKEKFSFAGSILIPPGAKTKTSETFDTDHKRVGLMAYVTLPDGVKVMLIERTAASSKDPTPVKEILERTGVFLLDRRDDHSYMLVLERPAGLIVQGEVWTVEPGLGCGTERELIGVGQVAETIAICDSLAK